MKSIQDQQKMGKLGSFYDINTKANQDYIKFWKEHTLFHWDFWLSLIFMITPIIFWITFRKKESSNRLLFVGFFVTIITSYFDFKHYFSQASVPLLVNPYFYG